MYPTEGPVTLRTGVVESNSLFGDCYVTEQRTRGRHRQNMHFGYAHGVGLGVAWAPLRWTRLDE